MNLPIPFFIRETKLQSLPMSQFELMNFNLSYHNKKYRTLKPIKKNGFTRQR